MVVLRLSVFPFKMIEIVNIAEKSVNPSTYFKTGKYVLDIIRLRRNRIIVMFGFYNGISRYTSISLANAD